MSKPIPVFAFAFNAFAFTCPASGAAAPTSPRYSGGGGGELALPREPGSRTLRRRLASRPFSQARLHGLRSRFESRKRAGLQTAHRRWAATPQIRIRLAARNRGKVGGFRRICARAARRGGEHTFAAPNFIRPAEYRTLGPGAGRFRATSRSTRQRRGDLLSRAPTPGQSVFPLGKTDAPAQAPTCATI